MKMSRKWILVAALVLSVAMASSGTIAYLQDSDSDVNVMTMGSVHIKQHEYERVVNADGSYATDTIDGKTSYVLKEFTQGKPIVPIVGDPTLSANDPGYAGWDTTPVRMSQVDSYGGMQVFAGKNAQDKFVTVENTGKSPAYVRTLVAIEIGDADASDDLVGSSYHSTWTKNEIGTIKIDGNNYQLFEYLYAGGKLDDGTWRHENGALPAGDTTYPNLSQVYLKSAATNEDLEAIDGNDNGLLDILVVSQAVQADGFTATDDKTAAQVALDTAFGEVSATSHPWLDMNGIEEGDQEPDFVTATNAEDLATVLNDGGSVIMKNDIDAGGQVFVVNGSVLDGMGYTLKVDSGSAAYESGLTVSEGTVKNVVVEGAFRGLGVGGSGASKMTGNAVYENVTVKGATYGINIGVGNGHKITMKNCTFGDWNSYSGLSGAEFIGCTFTSEGNYYASQRISADATFTYTNCEFKQNTYNNVAGSDNYYLNSYYGTGTIVLDNCTMNGVKITTENVNTLFQIEDVHVEVR